MANPKKPASIALLHGNPGKRRLNKAEPKITGKAKCPAWLPLLAKREWRRILAEFGDTGLITAADQAALAAYCIAYARWKQAEAQVTHEGQTVREEVYTRSGNSTGKYRVKRHPTTIVAKDERAAMLTAARLFGFDPSSRGRIVLPDSPDEQPNEDDDSDLYGPIQ